MLNFAAQDFLQKRWFHTGNYARMLSRTSAAASDRTEAIGRMDKGNSGHAGGAVIALDIAQVHRSLQMVSLTDKADILPLGKTGAAEALLIADIFIQLIIV